MENQQLLDGIAQCIGDIGKTDAKINEISICLNLVNIKRISLSEDRIKSLERMLKQYTTLLITQTKEYAELNELLFI